MFRQAQNIPSSNDRLCASGASVFYNNALVYGSAEATYAQGYLMCTSLKNEVIGMQPSHFNLACHIVMIFCCCPDRQSLIFISPPFHPGGSWSAGCGAIQWNASSGILIASCNRYATPHFLTCGGNIMTPFLTFRPTLLASDMMRFPA